MTSPLKRLYSLSTSGRTVQFVRRGVQHSLELPSLEMAKAIPYLQTRLSMKHLERITGVCESDLIQLKAQFLDDELVENDGPTHITGTDFYASFRNALGDWMAEAFSAPYWEVMLSGKGSQALFTGYLAELYHFTKNANRHMPMVVAHCPSEWKEVKRLFAMHYFEEWDHYDFFADALVAMGVSREDVENSDPLPSTLEMSNFMRQAARTSPLCYAICSAILEGTTEDSGSYGEYFKKNSTTL